MVELCPQSLDPGPLKSILCRRNSFVVGDSVQPEFRSRCQASKKRGGLSRYQGQARLAVQVGCLARLE